MTLAGELAYAEEMRQQLGLPKTVLNVDSPEMAAQIAQREAAYLQLDLPADAVHFVDTNEAVARQVSAPLLHFWPVAASP